MSRRIEKAAELLQAHGFSLGAGLVLLLLAVLGVRWVASNREAPPPRKVMQFTVVNVQQPPPPKPIPPPPRPVLPPKVVEQQPQTTRVEIKTSEIPPPDAPRPAPSAPSGGGRLALAAEGEGPGDAFNLAGNPGGRGLLSGGGLGDGSGEGGSLGQGVGNAARYGWYYAKVAGEIERAFRKQKKLSTASTRVELRVWADASGRISQVQLIQSTGELALDGAIQSVVGLRLTEPPPRDIPMPMIARLTARRLE